MDIENYQNRNSFESNSRPASGLAIRSPIQATFQNFHVLPVEILKG